LRRRLTRSCWSFSPMVRSDTNVHIFFFFASSMVVSITLSAEARLMPWLQVISRGVSPAAREARGSANYPRRRQRRRWRVGCRRSTSALLYLDTALAMQPRWCRARCVLCRRRRRRCGSRSARHREQCALFAEAPLTDHSKRSRVRTTAAIVVVILTFIDV
jgi:hypothetical protein